MPCRYCSLASFSGPMFHSLLVGGTYSGSVSFMIFRMSTLIFASIAVWNMSFHTSNVVGGCEPPAFSHKYGISSIAFVPLYIAKLSDCAMLSHRKVLINHLTQDRNKRKSFTASMLFLGCADRPARRQQPANEVSALLTSSAPQKKSPEWGSQKE